MYCDGVDGTPYRSTTCYMVVLFSHSQFHPVPPVTGQSKVECYRMALSPALQLNMMETRTRAVVVLQYTVGRAWAREGNTTSE